MSQMALCSRTKRVCSMREAHPPVAHEAGVLNARARVNRQRAVGIQPHLAEVVATQAVLSDLVAAVDLRAVPPVGDLVDETRGGGLFDHRRLRVGSDLRPADRQLGLLVAVACGVVRRQRTSMNVAGHGIAVADPVMVHELDPRRGQQIEEGDFFHFWSAIAIVGRA